MQWRYLLGGILVTCLFQIGIKMKTNIILNGDALEQLKTLPDESINCVMTSPPYWALRDYGVEGQLGLEPTFDEYINKLCDIFDEVKRVLRDDGTCWVNLGDTYSTQSGNMRSEEFNHPKYQKAKKVMNFIQPKTHLPDKTLCMIPFRFAIEMVNRGWILRNTIIWHKPNVMPSSVKDRFTVDFEYLFFFSKNKKYYFETQYEPHLTNENRPEGVVRERTMKYQSKRNLNPKAYKSYSLRDVHGGKTSPDAYNPLGRNKRTVWSINPKPFKEAHFAVYPEELCETPIKAGCPEFVCVKCGNPKTAIFEPSEEYAKNLRNQGKGWSSERRKEAIKIGNAMTEAKKHISSEYIHKGYKSRCSCNTEFTSGIVFDPFFGSGTTGLVALKQNKKFIGIELNKEYIEIAKARLKPYLEQTKF